MSSITNTPKNIFKITWMLSLLFLWSCAKERPFEAVYKVAELQSVSAVDTNSKYLYLISTEGADKEVTSAMPFYQGDVKVVSLKFEKDGLKVFEPEQDERFNSEENSSPVITIPGDYKAFRCRKDAKGDCTQEEEENTELEWNQKTHFVPDFAGMKVEETNSLHLFNLDNGCISELGTKLVNYEMKPGVINVELEKTYKTSDNFQCIEEYYYSDKLRNSTFKVKYFYSMVRVEDIASKDYEKVDYPIEDHSVFGFFKTETKKLNQVYDRRREEINYLLHRWNPAKEEVVYHLSDSFNKEENLYLKKATYEVFEKINQSMAKVGVKTKFKLAEPSGKSSGDLRYSSIVLITDPLANGLLGYGPVVPNPMTGEILQGHVNMYAGVLKSIARDTYEEMIKLSKENIVKVSGEKSKLPGPPSVLSNEAMRPLHLSDKHSHKYQDQLKKINVSKVTSLNSALAKENFKKIVDKNLLKAIDENQEAKNSKKNDEVLNPSTDLEKIVKICSENNAYHESMVNTSVLAKSEIKGISKIKDIKNNDGTLKEWNQLTEEQIKELSEIIMVHNYKTTLLHEMGHNLGLRHNFAGSSDKENFYTEDENHAMGIEGKSAYSSIMDYGYSNLNELSTYGKYDLAALKFGYLRKVEGKDGKTLKIEKDLKSVSKKDLKSYRFCTDENAGLSSLCNRFDEGTNLVEVATNMIENYQDTYEKVNWRRERNEFSIYGIGSYVGNRNYYMSRMRSIFEDYEQFYQFAPADLVQNGCDAELAKKYQAFCAQLDDALSAMKLVANFLIDVIKTPDLSCALTTLADKNKTVEVVSLREIYESELKYDLDYVPSTCFDENVKQYFAGKELNVKGEAGKYLNDINDPDPRFRYLSDIRVRGIWADKLLAMKFLTSRNSGISSTEATKGSFVDHPEISQKVLELVEHMVVGSPLSEAIEFTKEDGSKYGESMFNSLMGAGGVIPEQPLKGISMYFQLPLFNNVELNRVLLNQVVRYTKTTDLTYKNISKSLVNSLSVVKASKYALSSDNYVERKINDTKFLADDENIFANFMLSSMDHLDLLQSVSMDTIAKVFSARTTLPAGLSKDQMAVISKIPASEIPGLIDLLIQLGKNAPPAEQMQAPLDSVIRLGVEGLKGVLQILADLETPAADATDEEKALYNIALSTISEFAEGTLEKKVEFFNSTIDLLPAL